MVGAMRDKTLDPLTEEECWTLVGGHVVGRVALSGDAGTAPVVFPVNYTSDGKSVVFRTAVGTTLALIAGRAVSFEVDHIDVASASGWSVLLRGSAHELTHWESDHLDIGTWAPGHRTHFVRVVPGIVTGRRITPDLWQDPSGYL